jgi:hypothetical protein
MVMKFQVSSKVCIYLLLLSMSIQQKRGIYHETHYHIRTVHYFETVIPFPLMYQACY